MDRSQIKKIPVLGKWASKVYGWMNKNSGFSNSGEYWEERYRKGGNSGAGSYSNLAEFKAEVINDFISKHPIHSVMEFGSGDGNQIHYFRMPSYTGYDISPTAVRNCRKLYKEDPSKQFRLMEDYGGEKADLTLSLDVIYHLVEDEIYERYMHRLFGASGKWVIIYSSDSDDHENNGMVKHVRHRKFTNWVAENAPGFALILTIPNKYPFDGNGERSSYADFFIFERK